MADGLGFYSQGVAEADRWVAAARQMVQTPAARGEAEGDGELPKVGTANFIFSPLNANPLIR